MKTIAPLDLDGYAIGGLAVGEPAEVMYDVIEHVTPHMPENKIRYLMGVGTPVNILNAVDRGVDLFDCVMPSRNARHGHLFTSAGIINLNNNKYETDMRPIDEKCDCPTCKRYSRAYIRHLMALSPHQQPFADLIEYADKNSVPILLPESVAFLSQILRVYKPKKILEIRYVLMLLNKNKSPNIATRNVTYGLPGSGCHTGIKPSGVR